MQFLTRKALVLVAATLFLAACSGGDSTTTTEPDVASSEAPTTEAVPTTIAASTNQAPDQTTPPNDRPLVLAVPSGEATITLDTPESGGGKHPLLKWSELDGTAYYGVYIYAPSGDAYWFWRGETNEIFVGGSIQLDDDAMGFAITAEMTWGVVGYSEDGSVVGVSELAPLAP